MFGADDKSVDTWIELHNKMLYTLGGLPKRIIAQKCTSAQIGGRLKPFYSELEEYYKVFIELQEFKCFEGLDDIFDYLNNSIKGAEIFDNEQSLTRYLEEVSDIYLKMTIPGRCSRERLFKEGEQGMLRELPSERYRPMTRHKAQVRFDYHISIEGCKYSVPWEIAIMQDKYVEIEITKQSVRIFHHDKLVAVHPNISGKFGTTYSTRIEHMPLLGEEVQEPKIKWGVEKIKSWASDIGVECCRVIDGVMASKSIVQQSYSTCISILALSKTYSEKELEDACREIKSYNGRVSDRIKKILEVNREKR